ncbi:probable COQ4 protein, responsible for restoring ubiquinone biosynthesis [Claviceps purpurea 20.1]|uniref:4-hydroxy-3-methoxy-5-polyprenylbenzoate decarboxylase n=1 Tax=Claviceps purpurea (strain 20.1) TaxID=1111077 RepID=M1WEE8_CLAP2|nr:Ubiquinone biosynthesis protein [Claviceps purpurea]CCE32723.1 probable COQ4 protein, responsible for restoring ubiquinone biosynthesis [Claviceps purpurea 20.1]KAG6164426.1 Ubiquinone biosynthesis protein [Claviceps purpurea]KAG6182598.1 Ubiquinone biosynthesis protein [Claviceps purpurea]KAG6182830.1 Ubiquinone biosynthesis protein [Claviceps purpurea]
MDVVLGRAWPTGRPALRGLVTCARCASLTSTSTSTPASTPKDRQFSVLHRPPPNYPGHVPLTTTERLAMAIGSSAMALINPYRADLIAMVGESTATPYFIYRLRDAMLADPTGRRILRLRPRITSQTLSLDHLRSLPEYTLGHAYVSWLDREGVSPDTRSPTRYIDDEECAYVMQRYRECHDFYHALTGLPIVREGEVALKAFEWANTGLPMPGLSMLAAATMKPQERRRFWSIYLPWALRNGSRSKPIINVFWEEMLERRVDDLRGELGIERPPDLRELRKRAREEERRLREIREKGI